MDNHKQLLDKEYESLLQQFAKELEKLQVKHSQDLERKVSYSLIVGTLRDFHPAENSIWICVCIFLYRIWNMEVFSGINNKNAKISSWILITKSNISIIWTKCRNLDVKDWVFKI